MKVFRLPLLSYLCPADNGRGISSHIHRPTSTEITSQATHNTVQSLPFVVVLIIIRNCWTAKCEFTRRKRLKQEANPF